MMRAALLLALLALCARGADDTLIRELVEELGDEDAHVRRTARKQIVELGKPAVQALTEALGNDSVVVRTEAALALGEMGTVAEEAAPALEKLLNHEDLGLRRVALEALERVAPTWNLVARIEAFLKAKEHDALLRLLANPRIEAADPAVLPVLVRLLEQHRADVRAAAARAIGRFKERAAFAITPLIAAGGSQHWSVRFAVRDALVAIGPKSAEPLIEAMAGKGASAQPWAASVFFGLGPKCVAAGIVALDSENKQVRAAAAEALGAAGPGAALAVNRLIRALDDPAGMVRRSAAVALGSMGAHALDACPALITLANDPERRATLNAVWALGAIAQEVARPAPTGTQASGKKERDAIALGLAWLARHQDEDGRWDCDGFAKHDPRDDQCDGPGGKAFDLGVTGLALLAFLERGVRQEDARLIRKGARYLVSSQTEIGFLGTRASAHYMYNHALATAGITAAYLRTGDPIYRDCAKKALRFIVDSRNPDRAWRYAPQDGENDTSVTGWMVFALKLGSMAGLGVDERAFRGALSYLGTVTDAATGQVGYMEGMKGSARPTALTRSHPAEKTRAMTATALLIRLYAGQVPRREPLLGLGADACAELLPEWNPDTGTIDLYYWLQGTRALHYVGGQPWRKWSTAMRALAWKHQHPIGSGSRTGSWDPIGAWGPDGGRVYATAAMTLALKALDGQLTPLRLQPSREARARTAFAVLRQAAVHQDESIRRVALEALAPFGID